MTGKEKFDLPESTFEIYVNSILSLGTFFSVMAVILIVMSERIYQRFNILKEEGKED